jgi:hypothetical protein
MATTRVATRPHPGESHEPRPRGGELPREYWSAYDPFVALMAAAPIQATNREIVNDSPLGRLYQ